jgi:DNA-binding MarR family transcriptional regulator
MPPAVPELADHLGYWLRQLSNHVTHSFARKLAAKDVTVAEWALMRSLYARRPIPPSRLADEMGVTRGAVSKLADRLIAKALLARDADRDDKRAQTLRLTAEGVAFVPKLAALADQNEQECFAHLSAEDRLVLRRILQVTAARLGLTAVPVE